MRKLLKPAVALSLIASLAVAQEPARTYGGEALVAITAAPPRWDPSASTSQEIPRVVYGNVYEGLVIFDRDGSIVPALATDWPTSDDLLTWTFNIREGVKSDDGSDRQLADIVAR